MSLDTVAMIGYEHGEFREAPEDWFSGTDLLIRGTKGTDNWIRGRYYDEVIKQITGYTLYHEELQQLNKWFKIAAEKGCFLEAWY
jgi:hypothetical protein